jgi:hypothetical protein
MSLPQVQLLGGPFTDSELNVLALGTLVMELSQDEQISTTAGQACGGIKIKIALDDDGNVVSSPAQYVLPTDQLIPVGAFYTVWAYSAEGELAWGPNYNLLCPLGGGTFNVNNWIPNTTGVNGGTTSAIALQTNGVNNPVQTIENLIAGTNITLVADDAGGTTINAASSGGNGPRNRSWHGWTADGSDSASPSPVDGFGCTPSMSSASPLGVAPTATTPTMVNINTSSSSSVQYIAANGGTHTLGDTVTLGILGLSEFQVQQPALTTKRVWIGLLGDMPNDATFYASDTPVAPACAFRYSTNASDVDWQCVVTDGTTQLTVSSSVAVDTAVHKFAIVFSNPNVLFYIDGTLVATVAITTTTLTTATGFCPSATVDNIASSNNVAFNFCYLYWDTNV